MAKKVKPGRLRGNTTPNLLTPDPNDFVLQLAGGMKYSLAYLPTQLMFQVPANGFTAGKQYYIKISTHSSSGSKLLKELRLIVSDIRLTCV